MTNLQLKYYPNEILRKICQTVNLISEDEVKEIQAAIPIMTEILREQNGRGLAAPQLGLDKRLFLMHKEVEFGCNRPSSYPKVLINPIIVAASEEMILSTEGCLSIPGIEVKVRRHKQVTLSYLNENMQECVEDFKSFNNSRCVQHEVDHLNGKLILDHIESSLIQKLTIERYHKRRRRATI